MLEPTDFASLGSRPNDSISQGFTPGKGTDHLQDSGSIRTVTNTRPKDSCGFKFHGFLTLEEGEELHPTQPIVDTQENKKKQENAIIVNDVILFIALETIQPLIL